MQIGKKIYFDKITGNIIHTIGEMQGYISSTTIEEDFQTYQVLQGRIPETIGMVQLEYGKYSEEFSRCSGYKINIETREIMFDFAPQVEKEIQQEKTLEEKLAEQELLLIDAYEAIAMLHEELEILKGESV